MLRKIGIILLLYYAAGTCASQGATALSGGPRPEKIRNVRMTRARRVDTLGRQPDEKLSPVSRTMRSRLRARHNQSSN